MKTIIISLMLILSCQSAYAGISEQDGTLAILGEAGPRYEERLAIAFALQNRGTVQGVYGLRVAKTRDYSGQDYQNASRAWNEAKNGAVADVTKGSTHWLSDYDLKHCRKALTAFRFKMVETAYIGTTHFYREIK